MKAALAFCAAAAVHQIFTRSLVARIEREEKFLGGIYLERGMPRVESAHGFGTELAGRVDVCRQTLAHGGIAHLAAPRLGESDRRNVARR